MLSGKYVQKNKSLNVRLHLLGKYKRKNTQSNPLIFFEDLGRSCESSSGSFVTSIWSCHIFYVVEEIGSSNLWLFLQELRPQTCKYCNNFVTPANIVMTTWKLSTQWKNCAVTPSQNQHTIWMRSSQRQTVWMMHKHGAADMFVCLEKVGGMGWSAACNTGTLCSFPRHMSNSLTHQYSCSDASAKSCCKFA